jgi:hypothetical protein
MLGVEGRRVFVEGSDPARVKGVERMGRENVDTKQSVPIAVRYQHRN